MKILLKIPDAIYRPLHTHLVPDKFSVEEAAFAYARIVHTEGTTSFECFEWMPIINEGFVQRSSVNLELADETKALAIKRAHDLQASIIEFHSHTGSWPASFSPSDVYGFQELVPHVWWRLKGRPYAAVVFSKSGFDGFAWIADPYEPQQLDGIVVGKGFYASTGLSLRKEKFNYE